MWAELLFDLYRHLGIVINADLRKEVFPLDFYESNLWEIRHSIINKIAVRNLVCVNTVQLVMYTIIHNVSVFASI